MSDATQIDLASIDPALCPPGTELHIANVGAVTITEILAGHRLDAPDPANPAQKVAVAAPGQRAIRVLINGAPMSNTISEATPLPATVVKYPDGFTPLVPAAAPEPAAPLFAADPPAPPAPGAAPEAPVAPVTPPLPAAAPPPPVEAPVAPPAGLAPTAPSSAEAIAETVLDAVGGQGDRISFKKLRDQLDAAGVSKDALSVDALKALIAKRGWTSSGASVFFGPATPEAPQAPAAPPLPGTPAPPPVTEPTPAPEPVGTTAAGTPIDHEPTGPGHAELDQACDQAIAQDAAPRKRAEPVTLDHIAAAFTPMVNAGGIVVPEVVLERSDIEMWGSFLKSMVQIGVVEPADVRRYVFPG